MLTFFKKKLGITFTEDFRWNAHYSNICANANRALDFLRHYLYSCPHWNTPYKGPVRPVLEHGSSVWDPQGVVLQGDFFRKCTKAHCQMCNFMETTTMILGL